jgi:tetratricopeptide (TPR) repeat protein
VIEIVRRAPAAVTLPEDVRRLTVGAVLGQTEDDAAWARDAADLLEHHLARAAGKPAGYEILPARDAARADAVLTAVVRVTQERSGRSEAAGERLACKAEMALALERPGGATLLAQRLSETYDSCEHPGVKPPAPGKPTHALMVNLLDRCAVRFVGQLVPVRMVIREVILSGPSAQLAEGNKLAAAGQYESALARYQQALAASPDDPAATFNAGLMCELLERLDLAERYYRRACELTKGESHRASLERVRRWRQVREQSRAPASAPRQGGKR